VFGAEKHCLHDTQLLVENRHGREKHAAHADSTLSACRSDFLRPRQQTSTQVENLAASRDFEKELNLQVEAGANSVVSQNFEKELNLQGQAGPSQSQHKGKKKN
jgi:hypothetical protein